MQIGLIFCFLIGLGFFYWLFVGLTQGKSIQKDIDENQRRRKIEKLKFKEDLFNSESIKLGYEFGSFLSQTNYPYIKLPKIETQENLKEPQLNEAVIYNSADKHIIGRSEFVFEEILTKKYGQDLIFGGGLYCLKNYKPDIAYIDKVNKIFIDIEIDEIYEYKNKTPIHYFDLINENGKRRINDTNEQRDRTFVSCGWSVIRFSEEQILNNINECIEFVDYVINYWLRNLTNYKLTTNKIKISKRWTSLEAKLLAQNNHRDKIYNDYLENQPASYGEPTKLNLQDFLSEIKNVTPSTFYDFRKEDE